MTRILDERLALDHLTVVDTTPSQLVDVAAEVGCQAICLFMEPMAVLPQMPPFDIYRDTPERCETKARLDDLNIAVDIAYPFTLSSRTDLAAFHGPMETAAFLGARYVNTLLYDRDPARREDVFTAFCAQAAEYGLGVVAEFYPVSQIRSLEEAVALVRKVGRPGEVGVNVDQLHLVRSGGTLADIAAAPAEYLLYGQYCDGQADYDREKLDYEASSQRMLAGEGAFDVAGFAAALPASAGRSVELPREDALLGGISLIERARAAVGSVRARLGSE
jgi:sugar phosphate isomerase/epimerase